MAATKMFFRSGRLLGSLLGSLLKYNVLDFEVFQEMVFIFHLDMNVVCSIKIFQILIWICRFFRSETLLGSLLRHFLKYNVLDVFQKVFQMTSWKSSSI
ncbi:hypothetical protein IGI04_037192 [Brassica rapa subsp. trilocularis]|uniref:Uncharacterized protein n=1 Tax=Brassica rapa subsp. trilocularis TaxID=1813537 RepID=A0ABQ7LHJ4_BRACM|nr:hypothetical protein IGI04_037192 [Brassica rapa subsp. trilocularis]